MAKFKVGDRARYIGRKKVNEEDKGHPGIKRGMTLTIIGEYALLNTKLGMRYGHLVKFDGFENACIYCEPEWMEPLQKRPELGSLDEIEKLTGWRPGRVREAV